MNKIKLALLTLVLGSCATTQKTGKQVNNPKNIIFFSSDYRALLSDEDILERKDATFLNSKEVKLIGVPEDIRSLYFEDSYLIEGNWKLITLPIRTFGKAIEVNKEKGIITTQHSEKNPISFTWVAKGYYYNLDYKKDEEPKVPQGIKVKYNIDKNHPYINYLGGKFYIIDGSDAKLEVHHQVLDPDEIELKGLRK